MKDEDLRDLGLILFGYAMAGDSSKAHVMGMVEPYELPKDIANLLEALASGTRTPAVNQWLDARGIAADKGVRIIDAIGAAVRANTRRVARKALSTKVQGFGSLSRSDEEYVNSLLEEIEAFKKLMARQ